MKPSKSAIFSFVLFLTISFSGFSQEDAPIILEMPNGDSEVMTVDLETLKANAVTSTTVDAAVEPLQTTQKPSYFLNGAPITDLNLVDPNMITNVEVVENKIYITTTLGETSTVVATRY